MTRRTMTHADAQAALRRLRLQLELAMKAVDNTLSLPLPSEGDDGEVNYARAVETAIGNVPSMSDEEGPLRDLDRIYLEDWFS